ncbi:MAG: hypothetical protein GKR94_24855 [Gammaproteobacteria bacterium]|nr:hypothetical protein [Gammaproteobacteria bacterium]
MAFAWADAINVEAKALADAGAAVVQFDEPVFSRCPAKVAGWGIAALDIPITLQDANIGALII